MARVTVDAQAQRLLARHLETLRTFRAVDACCAFLWPQEARLAHSVIASDGRHAASVVLEQRACQLEAMLRADEEGA